MKVINSEKLPIKCWCNNPDGRYDAVRSEYWNAALEAVIAKIRSG
jgi:hypothetical protein